MDINANIKILCKARGLSFQDLADRLQVTRQTLHRQSTGAAQLSTLDKIAAALKVPTFIILHPAPLAALMQYEGRNQAPEIQTQEPGTPAAPVVLCPHCHASLSIQINQEPTPADDQTTATRKQGRPRKTSTDDKSTLF